MQEKRLFVMVTEEELGGTAETQARLDLKAYTGAWIS